MPPLLWPPATPPCATDCGPTHAARLPPTLFAGRVRSPDTAHADALPHSPTLPSTSGACTVAWLRRFPSADATRPRRDRPFSWLDKGLRPALFSTLRS